MNDLKKTEPKLPQKEVERIWGLTEFMSAQTPLETRMMVVKMIDAGITFTPRELFEMTVLLDLRAAMTKDESKFAHLVAGTETIVKTLQNVNPLMRHLERQEALIGSLSEQLDRTEAKLDTVMQAMAEGGKVTIKHEVLTGGDEEAAYLAETAVETISKQAEETHEEYDGQVGSAWDPKNPAKGPVKLPTASEEYETQSKAFRKRVLKHS